MKFSILINTHNQSKYLFRCIDSCLNQTYKGSYEVIICDTSSKSNVEIIKKIKSNRLLYFYKKKFSNYPVLDQLLKIQFAYKKAKGQIICLLDGDDFFHKNKLRSISKIISKKKIVYHDLPIYYLEELKLKKYIKIPFYKSFLFYKKFINNWPIILGTSCLFFNREILKNFFLSDKVYNHNLLALDSKLAIFSEKFYHYKILQKNFTYKSVSNFNLDKKYNRFFSRVFWKRRKQQIEYQSDMGIKHLNLNNLITNTINWLVNVKKF
jgi:hypothetical protein